MHCLSGFLHEVDDHLATTSGAIAAVRVERLRRGSPRDDERRDRSGARRASPPWLACGDDSATRDRGRGVAERCAVSFTRSAFGPRSCGWRRQRAALACARALRPVSNARSAPRADDRRAEARPVIDRRRCDPFVRGSTRGQATARSAPVTAGASALSIRLRARSVRAESGSLPRPRLLCISAASRLPSSTDHASSAISRALTSR